ncbi:MAG: hypothetical protein V7739_02500 [Motiliproteus sp.]
MRPIICTRIAIVVALLSVFGCSAQTLDSNSSTSVHDERKQRQLSMREAWIGKSTIELIRACGQPSSMLVLPPKNEMVNSAYVYESKGADGCMDAFVVQEESGIITDYFCR